MADNNPMDPSEIKIGGKSEQLVTCSQCRKELKANQCYTYKGAKGEEVFLCDSCHANAEQAFKAETENPNMLGAFLLGSVAAVIAGILWFAISVITGWQIGYVAIGVGFLIGYAVLLGSGKKRGMPLQIMSAVMTLITLFVSQYFTTLYYIRKYLLENKEQFPDYTGQFFLVNPFAPDIIKAMISPIGLVIWAVGIYFAYSLPKSRSI